MRHEAFERYKHELIERATRLHWRCHLSHPPYDVDVVAKHLSVDVRTICLEGLDGYVEPAERQSQYDWKVYVSARAPRQRRRFTLAHELGHVVLMAGARAGQYAGLIRYRSRIVLSDVQDPAEEALCNVFAAELLMPIAEARKNINCRSLGPDTVVAMASLFDVSIHMTARRIVDLFSGRGISCSCWDLSTPWPVIKWQAGVRPRNRKEQMRMEDFVGTAAGLGLPMRAVWDRFGNEKNEHEVRVLVLPASSSAIFFALAHNAELARAAEMGPTIGTQLTLW